MKKISLYNKEESAKGRRTLLVSLGLLATSVSLAPSRWSKPIIDSVVLPVHAQTSPVPSGRTLRPEFQLALVDVDNRTPTGEIVEIQVLARVRFRACGMEPGVPVTIDATAMMTPAGEISLFSETLSSSATGSFTLNVVLPTTTIVALADLQSIQFEIDGVTDEFSYTASVADLRDAIDATTSPLTC